MIIKSTEIFSKIDNEINKVELLVLRMVRTNIHKYKVILGFWIL